MLQQDQDRVHDAEIKANAYGVQCESRIAELEMKLSELSESVGNYERLRYQDQQAIAVSVIPIILFILIIKFSMISNFCCLMLYHTVLFVTSRLSTIFELEFLTSVLRIRLN